MLLLFVVVSVVLCSYPHTCIFYKVAAVMVPLMSQSLLVITGEYRHSKQVDFQASCWKDGALK